MSAKRTAVVVVHGMGQQRPGRLQRSLGRALASEGDEVYVAPDRISGRTDTHRVTIAKPDGTETHVYEHYWSDRFQDTKLRHVTPWALRLLLHPSLGSRIGSRNSALEWLLGLIAAFPYLLLAVVGSWDREAAGDILELVPEVSLILAIALAGLGMSAVVVRERWVAILGGAVTGAAAAVVLAPPFGSFEFASALFILLWAPAWLLIASGLQGVGPISVVRMLLVLALLVTGSLSLVSGSLVIGGLPAVLTVGALGFWVRHWFGDVARYLDRSAANAEEADHLRRDAAEFLWRVCSDDRYGYEDVVVVAHSQGGFVAYDAVTSVWERWSADRHLEFGETTAAEGVDRLAGDREPGPDEWNAATTTLREATGDAGDGWKIRHFVTLGSPIGHAALLAVDEEALANAISSRRLSTAPPALHGDPPSIAFRSGAHRRLHHTSVFGATSWTNVVFNNDLLGAALDSAGLGGAVTNVVLGADDRNFSPTVLDFALRFPHDSYWETGKRVLQPHTDVSLDVLRRIAG